MKKREKETKKEKGKYSDFPFADKDQAYTRKAIYFYRIEKIIFEAGKIFHNREKLAFAFKYSDMKTLCDFEVYRFGTSFLYLMNRYMYYYFFYNPIPFYTALERKVNAEDIFYEEEQIFKDKYLYRAVKYFLVKSRYLREFLYFTADLNDDRGFITHYYKDRDIYVIPKSTKKITKRLVAALNTRRVVFSYPGYYAWNYRDVLREFLNPPKLPF